MVAVRPAEQDRFARRPPAGIDVVLVYGPDAGLVHERCLDLAQSAVSDIADPFQLVRLDDRDVAGHAERLVEEAGAVALFGDRKAIWLRVVDKAVDRAVKLVLQSPPGGNLVLIEAGDLAKQSALRVACEQSPRAAALPCYAGGPEETGRLVDAMLREAGLAIEPEARHDLVDALPEDRRQARAEIDKLLLYMDADATVAPADVKAVIVDAQTVALDDVVDAAFGGDHEALDRHVSRALAERLGPDALLAPPWVPWQDRLRPGDVGIGDLLPAHPDDERLAPIAVLDGDDAVTDWFTPRPDTENEDAGPRIAEEIPTPGRSRVLSAIGRDDTAERWYESDHGPRTPLSHAAPANCVSCGFFVPLSGGLGRLFGACGNAFAPDDGRVVSADHGCGAHSEAMLTGSAPQANAPVIDEFGYDLVDLPGVSVEETVFEPLSRDTYPEES